MSNGQSQHRHALWTPSNIITLVRICLVPVFVVALLSPWPEWFGISHLVDNQSKSLIAAGVFIVISCTDWVDGYLARKRNEVTDFGKFMDPLADKILVAAALLALIELQVLPAWPVLIILAREFIVSGIRMIAASQHTVIAASWYGKAKTVAQIVAIVLFLIKDSLVIPNADAAIHNPLYVISWAVMIVALALTIISMLDYIAKARHLLGFGGDDNSTSESTSIEDLAENVIRSAARHQITIGCAESLTGGLICAALTSIAGSSAVVKGGINSYTFDIKGKLLGVDEAFLAHEGAVNAQTAEQMARGARRALSCDLAVSVTGIAGPGGAEPGKPVGTVWMAIASKQGVCAHEYHFEGDRDGVRMSTVSQALRSLHDSIMQE